MVSYKALNTWIEGNGGIGGIGLIAFKSLFSNAAYMYPSTYPSRKPLSKGVCEKTLTQIKRKVVSINNR